MWLQMCLLERRPCRLRCSCHDRAQRAGRRRCKTLGQPMPAAQLCTLLMCSSPHTWHPSPFCFSISSLYLRAGRKQRQSGTTRHAVHATTHTGASQPHAQHLHTQRKPAAAQHSGSPLVLALLHLLHIQQRPALGAVRLTHLRYSTAADMLPGDDTASKPSSAGTRQPGGHCCQASQHIAFASTLPTSQSTHLGARVAAPVSYTHLRAHETHH